MPDRATLYGAEISRLVDCKVALVEQALIAIACGAFHIRSGGRLYYNTTRAWVGSGATAPYPWVDSAAEATAQRALANTSSPRARRAR